MGTHRQQQRHVTFLLVECLTIQEPEMPPPTKEGKLAKQSKSAAKRAAKLAAQAGADSLFDYTRHGSDEFDSNTALLSSHA